MKNGAHRLRAMAAFGIRDFLFGLALFWGVVIAFCSTHVPAHALGLLQSQPAAITSQARTSDGIETGTTQPRSYAAAAERPVPNLAAAGGNSTFVMLGFVFALLTMLNLAFIRHLRRAYGRPRALRARRAVRR